MPIALDDKDQRVVYELQRDARQSVEEIAERLQMAPEEVQQRIDDLEARGVIDGYHAKVNYDAAGVQHHYVFRCSTRISQREKLAAEAQEQLGVIQVYTLMTGRNNLLIFGAGTEKDDMTGLALDIDRLGIDIEGEALIRKHSWQPYGAFQLAAGSSAP